ncbi:MAG: coproporphyrinogen dehydrogenase HemZ [Clostridiales bacterium]|nr:coproporphyrinogen dehydrogenase HemZ [Clostridiales bacterium]
MITVAFNESNFEYDIHSLVKAFYPDQEVMVRAFSCKENIAAVDKDENAAEADGTDLTEREKKLAGRKRWKEAEFWTLARTAKFHLAVDYGEDVITFSFFLPWESEEPEEEEKNSDAPAIFPGEKATLTEKKAGLTEEKAVLTGRVSVKSSDRRETKNRLKQKLYELLAELSGTTLPWGTLTGIRPTKIPMAMLEEGQTEEAIRTCMRDTYFASDAKIDLSIEVAKREMELLSRIDYEDGYSLYIGIPFCPSTCLYCSFTSYPIGTWKKRVDEYLDALCREIAATAELMRGKYLNSVYIGGGTPTSLEPEHLERLITAIGENFELFDDRKHIVYGGLQQKDLCCGISGDLCQESFREKENGVNPEKRNISNNLRENHLLEFTVEVGRPDSITADKLKVLRRHNISRISINPQTMKEDTLRLIGRRHTVAQIKESFALARDMGFDNINMDLIVGLPEENLDDVRRTMEEIAKLAPDNVTVHSLAIKRASRLRMEREQYGYLHMENTWETIDLTADYCRRMGLSPYYLYRQKNMAGNFENVGYAAPGKAGVYNILIMEEKQTIMALGAGATTKVVYDHGTRIERVGNVKDITAYLERVDEMIERKRKLLDGHAAG